MFADVEDDGPQVVTKPDLRLKAPSLAKDKGIGLTEIISADGAGRSFQVADASYFMDGWGIVDADEIQILGTSTSATIANVNYDTNTITVTRDLSFRRGQKVVLAYNGLAPDLGAHELD